MMILHGLAIEPHPAGGFVALDGNGILIGYVWGSGNEWKSHFRGEERVNSGPTKRTVSLYLAARAGMVAS